MALSLKTGEVPWAFNKGSQARIDGVPVWENPYEDLVLAGWWEKGWWDANDHWGEQAKWSVTPLPRLRLFG